MKINNPIIPGFNPDPSIIRVKNEYYIATSTFEWFPGIQIHHSKDLLNWELICRPLSRKSQLDMSGIPPSCGVWAPCLTYSEGTYFIVYSYVKNFTGTWQDTDNFLITANSISGPWSEPVKINISGFDPSLYHEDENNKWILYAVYDFFKDGKKHDGIMIAKICTKTGALKSSPVKIFKGTDLGVTEGPHLYNINGRYFLITAEGGTGWGHAVTLARADEIKGPYEVHPENPILTSRYDKKLTFQKAGHGDIFQCHSGNWYMVHLATRPMGKENNSVLGRETCRQKLRWDNNWPSLWEGKREPSESADLSWNCDYIEKKNFSDDFNEKILNIRWQTLRRPLDDTQLSLKERHGYLRLKGKDSLESFFSQSLVAIRQEHMNFIASTCIEYEPDHRDQSAGIICIHDHRSYYYMRIYLNTEGQKKIGILSCTNDGFKKMDLMDITLENVKEYYLRANVQFCELQFYYSTDGIVWDKIGPVLDYGKLSDEASPVSWFTGTFIGLCCQDMTGQGKHADFKYFSYFGN